MIDIHDKESLAEWLKNKPREVGVVIAARAALRVLPLIEQSLHWKGKWDQDQARNELILSTFRFVNLSWIASLIPLNSKHYNFPIASQDNLYAKRNSASSAARAAVFAYRSRVENYIDNVFNSIKDSIDAEKYLNEEGSVEREIINDFNIISNRSNLESLAEFLSTVPLWRSHVSSSIFSSWLDLQKYLLDFPNEFWSVWVEWYDHRRQPQSGWSYNEGLEAEKCMLPDVEWLKGPASINSLIRKIIDARSIKINIDPLVELENLIKKEETKAQRNNNREDVSSYSSSERLKSDVSENSTYDAVQRAVERSKKSLSTAARQIVEETERSIKARLDASQGAILANMERSNAAQLDKLRQQFDEQARSAIADAVKNIDSTSASTLYERVDARIADSVGTNLVNALGKELEKRTSDNYLIEQANEAFERMRGRTLVYAENAKKQSEQFRWMGVGLGGFGLFVLALLTGINFWYFLVHMDKPTTTLDWSVFLMKHAPGYGFVMLCEFLALIMFRNSSKAYEYMRYFSNEASNIDARNIAFRTAMTTTVDKTKLVKMIERLEMTERNFILNKGQRTIEVANNEAEGRLAEKLTAMLNIKDSGKSDKR